MIDFCWVFSQSEKINSEIERVLAQSANQKQRLDALQEMTSVMLVPSKHLQVAAVPRVHEWFVKKRNFFVIILTDFGRSQCCCGLESS